MKGGEKMRKILLSIMTVALVSAAVVGVTRAYFSDQGSIAGNTVATGTLDLTLNHSAGKPFSVTNAYPGYWANWEYMDVYNSGSLPFEAQMTVSETGGPSALWNYILLEMETSGWDSTCHNGDGGERVIYSGFANVFPNGSVVSDTAYWHLANEDDGSGPPDNVPAGYSERICQRVGVDTSAGNDVQGISATFDEVVDAVQDND